MPHSEDTCIECQKLGRECPGCEEWGLGYDRLIEAERRQRMSAAEALQVLVDDVLYSRAWRSRRVIEAAEVLRDADYEVTR